MAPSPKKKKLNNGSVRKASSVASGHSRNSSVSKTEVIINVYDLLPPGRLSSLLWTIGGSLLHSGVVINDREYAYGGHNKRGVTGVYYTRPKYEPPGGTHRISILQGFTFHSPSEVERIIKEVSDEFLGPSYNLLTHNCNHFTSALVTALTGKAAPAWLNRAASIGLALPCMVPREWISPPDVETADGALLEDQEEHDEDDAIDTAHYKDDDDDDADERASMLETERHARLREEQRRAREEELRYRKEKRMSMKSRGASRMSSASLVKDNGRKGSATSSSAEEDSEEQSLAGGPRITTTDEPPPRFVKRTDSQGRELPVAERAPLPRSASSASASKS
ncbi:hypothetical protein CBER1_09390 [Cercospora berteroae]|uniref:PPPDE domain-containing protein n=1 Tax=Cercospora berteroae TaxID=357750 RepID=A0A2S6C8Z5_9PEZI|nr:hypothetical protein CBER1_09390 [Cercospora berteroae]